MYLAPVVARNSVWFYELASISGRWVYVDAHLRQWLYSVVSPEHERQYCADVYNEQRADFFLQTGCPSGRIF